MKVSQDSSQLMNKMKILRQLFDQENQREMRWHHEVSWLEGCNHFDLETRIDLFSAHPFLQVFLDKERSVLHLHWTHHPSFSSKHSSWSETRILVVKDTLLGFEEDVQSNILFLCQRNIKRILRRSKMLWNLTSKQSVTHVIPNGYPSWGGYIAVTTTNDSWKARKETMEEKTQIPAKN